MSSQHPAPLSDETLRELIAKSKLRQKHATADDLAELVRWVRGGSRTLDSRQAQFIIDVIESREVVSRDAGQQMAEEILRLREEKALWPKSLPTVDELHRVLILAWVNHPTTKVPSGPGDPDNVYFSVRKAVESLKEAGYARDAERGEG